MRWFDKLEFHRVGLVNLLVLTSVVGMGGYGAAEGQERPHRGRKLIEDPNPPMNIVVFLIDTLRADRLGVYGYTERPTSPRIDELAKEAVVFERAYAPAPWTLPSVASLASGTLPIEHGTLDDHLSLVERLKPIAQRLREQRYRTMGMYTNAYSGPEFGMERGFEIYQPLPLVNGKRTAALFDHYFREPFFLFIHNIEPHTPYSYAPLEPVEGFRAIPNERREELKRQCDAYRALTRADFSAQQPLGTTDNTLEQLACLKALTEMQADYNEIYDAAVRQADLHVGEVIDELKQRGAWDDTIFILLSDHGEEMNEHGGWLHDQSVYEELIRVPLLIRFPRGAFGGKRVSEAVSLIDVTQTVFAYLGKQKLAKTPSSINQMPLIDGSAGAAEEDFRVISMRINTKKYYKPWKESRGDINLVVLKGDWKGIWNVEPDTFELYDLASDPGERKNVADENVPLKLAMQLVAREYWERMRDHGFKPEKRETPIDTKTRNNLRELGYLD